MSNLGKEPIIAVGLVEDAADIAFDLGAQFYLHNRLFPAGAYRAFAAGDHLSLVNAEGREMLTLPALHLVPAAPQNASFTLHEVKIGKQFHWERAFSQMFRGELKIILTPSRQLTAINSIHVEDYLASVIASEMSPESPEEFLKAHCISSRSWLLRQLTYKTTGDQMGRKADYCTSEIICWTGREAHNDFDVCADDHCQRYQGMGRTNEAAIKAVRETRGKVLTNHGEICDARYAKCCGGITEEFATAWEDAAIPYLQSTADSAELLAPVVSEQDARQFILSRPPAYCNIEDKNIIRRILPDFDCETKDFFRWQADIAQDELRNLLLAKTGIDFGGITSIIPLVRGPSGRLLKIKIRGTREEKIIGKELEIRRILSPTHLLSSAFVVDPYGADAGIPRGFIIRGSGWGHGVGLCQIGAAGMAERGMSYRQILSHYFHGAQIVKLY
jgi:peptidoglycan hydrolase-like amidase